MPTVQCLTPGCSGDPSAPGCAGGRCPRCYQRHRRGLPPKAKSTIDPDRTMRVSLRMSPRFYRAIRAKARAANSNAQAWILEQLERALGVVR